jgi:hypothetical protein
VIPAYAHGLGGQKHIGRRNRHILGSSQEAAAAVNAIRHVSISFETASDALPALCSKDVVATIKEACF